MGLAKKLEQTETSIDDTNKTDNPAMEVIERFAISDDAASELAGELSEDYGLMKDVTWGNGYFLVLWHGVEDE